MAFTSTAGIAITGGGDINITDTQKITGVGKAISAREAARLAVTESTAGTVATKEYVDQEIATDPLCLVWILQDGNRNYITKCSCSVFK